uniref:Uncharacterized protein n=1 Tax=Sphenodon punctatus TaxID=8508 RepID=A0A8D0L8S9_SPHPU
MAPSALQGRHTNPKSPEVTFGLERESPFDFREPETESKFVSFLMAAANPEELLESELKCPVCLDYFNNPVTLDCGHNFCQVCITRSWEEWNGNVSCPECRQVFPKKSFKLNRKLGNVVEANQKVKLLSSPEKTCKIHNEPLKLFCQEDQVLICMVCHLARDHKHHTMIPIEEADQDYKAQIQNRVESLKKQREKVLVFKSNGETESWELLVGAAVIPEEINVHGVFLTLVILG